MIDIGSCLIRRRGIYQEAKVIAYSETKEVFAVVAKGKMVRLYADGRTSSPEYRHRNLRTADGLSIEPDTFGLIVMAQNSALQAHL